MDCSPVMIEIMDQRLKEHYNGNFLMQVWDKKALKKHERVLKYDLHAWSIQHDYFIYQLMKLEEGSGYTYIVNLLDGSTLKVKDFCNDESYVHLGINQ
jgi:hypothetical protein